MELGTSLSNCMRLGGQRFSVLTWCRQNPKGVSTDTSIHIYNTTSISLMTYGWPAILIYENNLKKLNTLQGYLEKFHPEPFAPELHHHCRQ